MRDSERIQQVVEIAKQVRKRLRGLGTQGLCRDVCLATALAAKDLDLDTPLAMCYGTVKAGSEGDPHAHWWLRHEEIVIDPTLDQFGVQAIDVFVKNEGDAAIPCYKEETHFCVQSERVLMLAGLIPPRW